MISRRKRIVINDFSVSEDFFDHRKTRKLERVAKRIEKVSPADPGELAFERLCRGLWKLWRWAACRGGPDQSHDGYLGTDAAEIASEADWPDDPQEFLAALLPPVGFLDHREADGAEPAGYWIHDFHGGQPHVALIMGKINASRENGAKGGRPPKETQPKPSRTQRKPRRTQSKPSKTQVEPAGTFAANPAEPSEAEAEAVHKKKNPKKGARSAKKASEVATGYPDCVDAWFVIFKTANDGAKPTWGKECGSQLKRLLKAHGPEKIKERLLNYELHHLEGSFGADQLDFLSGFVKWIDRWASPPDRKAQASSTRPTHAGALKEMFQTSDRAELPAGTTVLDQTGDDS